MESLMGRQADKPVSYTMLRQAYPPCVKGLSELQPIRLRDLEMETHHRGRVLVVRAFSDAFMTTKAPQPAVAVVDEHGDVDYLAICNLWPTTPIDKLLPKNAFMAIKEPYFKKHLDGDMLVQVDHPSDLVFLDIEDDSSLLPSSMLTSAEARCLLGEKTAAELKSMGNTAFRRSEWATAVKHYSAALRKLQGRTGPGYEYNADLLHDIFRNRAGARLRLGQYERAYEDALAAVIHQPDENGGDMGDVKAKNAKALFRAGRAAYELENFAQADECFNEAVCIDDKNEEAYSELLRTADSTLR